MGTGSHDRTGPAAEHADRQPGHAVQSSHEVGFRILQRPGGDQLAAHRLIFLSRLPDEADAAGKFLPPRGEDLGGTHHHRGVGVVAAGVHHARMDGSVFHTGIFRVFQRVDVGAERHVAAGAAPVQQRDGVGAEEGREHLQIQRFKPGADRFLRQRFMPRKLRNPVQVVAEFDDSGQDVSCGFHNSLYTILPPTMVSMVLHCTSQPSKGVLRELDLNCSLSTMYFASGSNTVRSAGFPGARL